MSFYVDFSTFLKVAFYIEEFPGNNFRCFTEALVY